MQEYRAKAGSVIVIDVDTGEVLAMVDQPSYNPNDREQLKPALYRNRAATDIFEPGSSIKPFIMAAALASGQYRPDSVVDTSPGFIQVGNKVFEDESNLGVVDLATILAKSSNVGTAKVALVAEARADLEHAHEPGIRAGDGQRISGRIGRHAQQLFPLAADRHRHALAWLRRVGDAAAARACLRDHRRRRHQAAHLLRAAAARPRQPIRFPASG